MSEKRKRRFTRCCCVVGCQSRVSKEKDVHFYSFPNKDYEVQRKKRWIAAVRRITKDGKAWNPSKHSLVCSKHFSGGKKSNNPMEEAYNPTIFPACYKKKATFDIGRAERAASRRKQRESQTKTLIVRNDVENWDVGPMEMQDFTVIAEPRMRDIHVQTDPCVVEDEEPSSSFYCSRDLVSCHIETQTDIILRRKLSNPKVIIEGIVKKPAVKDAHCGPDSEHSEGFYGYPDVTNDKSMKALCGVTVALFQILLQFINCKLPNQPKFYRTLSAENRLLLFLMKMKQGSSFVVLSVLFKISDRTASRIFFNVLDTLYQKTKTCIFWPPRELIKERLPKSFKNYPNCRAIIDCTEIRTDCPPTVEQRVHMFSSYKSAFTVKYLIAISPSGLITFLSKGYGGRSTDGFIANDSGFLNLLEPGDSVLADKGFPVIRGELAKRNCILVMPPFAYNPQFSESEVLEGYSIASVRIHVERAIQRVKIFQVLNHVSVECLPYIDKIMYMSCVLVNNKEPLITDANK